MEGQILAVKEKAKQLLAGGKGSHDWDHTERVFQTALHLAEKENAELLVLKLAALLHDIARPLQDECRGKICHAKKGAELAEQLLKENGFEKDLIEKVLHCIRAHRSRSIEKPESLEAKILFDADKLDKIGAIGIARAMVFAGEVGARVHFKGIEPEKTKPYGWDDSGYREFLVTLQQVKEKMLTVSGKEMAKERHQYMLEYFNRLNKEVDGLL